MTRADRDVPTVIALALVCAAVVVLVPLTAVRAVFAVPLCLALPGYAISSAAFTREPLGWLYRLWLVPAFSLASLALGAILLNVLPGGIRLASWVIFILVVVAAACVATLVRRRPYGAAPARVRALRLRPRDAILLLVAALAIGASFALSRVPLPASNALGYTQMSMSSSGSAGAPRLRIGIISAEKTTERYVLTVGNGAGDQVLSKFLILKPDQHLELSLALPPVKIPVAVATARLYRAGTPGVYRNVTAVFRNPRAHAAATSVVAAAQKRASATRQSRHRRRRT